MKKRGQAIWKDTICFEEGGMSGLRGLSLALFFVGNGESCPIFASRSPSRDMAPGVDLCRVLHLDREVRRYLDSGTYPAMAVCTPLGTGILSKRFTLTTGMGLYIHFHAPAGSVAAILCNRLLPGDYALSDSVEEAGCGMTAADEKVLDLIAPVWAELLELGRSFPHGDRDGYVTTDELIGWIGRAVFAVGCGLRTVSVCREPAYLEYLHDLTEDDIRSDRMPARRVVKAGTGQNVSGTITRTRWFGGSMWEAYLLYCLLQARMCDPERSITCILKTDNGENDGFLDMEFSFSMAVPEPEPGEEQADARPPRLPYPLRAGFACLEQATAYNGSTFILSNGQPMRAEYDLHTWVYPVTAHLSFLHDANLALEGDIKTDIELKYD